MSKGGVARDADSWVKEAKYGEYLNIGLPKVALQTAGG